jgi:hypothetical protein
MFSLIPYFVKVLDRTDVYQGYAWRILKRIAIQLLSLFPPSTGWISYHRGVWQQAQPHVSSAVYSNHLSRDEGPARVRAAYGEKKYDRLAALKAKYDPDNLFHLNHNIVPSVGCTE